MFFNLLNTLTRFNVIFNVLWGVTAEKQRCFLLIQLLTRCLFIFSKVLSKLLRSSLMAQQKIKLSLAKKKKKKVISLDLVCMQPHLSLSHPPLISSREKRGNLHKSRINREIGDLLGIVSLMAECDTLGLPVDFDSIKY